MTALRRALVVGLDDYSFGPLSGCVADATAVAEMLRTHADGTPDFDVRVLTAPPAQVSRAGLREAVADLLRVPADLALLYFSGHGSEDGLGGHLVTPDATEYEPGMPMSDVVLLANRSPVSEVVVVLDCCHSGRFGRSPADAGSSVEMREGLSVLTASRPEEAAVEQSGQGVFTGLLLAALDGGAADVQGNVTVAGAYAYVDESLGSWDQRPQLKAHVSRLTPLRRARPAVPAECLRRLPEHFPAAADELALDPSWEPTAPQAQPDRVARLRELQRLRAARLLEPVGHEHLYDAVMTGGSCRLTPLGRHYWALASRGRL